MVLSACELIKICSEETCNKDVPSIFFSNFLTDSRNLTYPDNTVFFAIKTTRNDGHNYIEQLYKKGVRGFVVHKGFAKENYKDAFFIEVENSLTALQKIAKYHRKKFTKPVIAISGSNGKTIVKEWLFYLLSKFETVIRSPKSYNSQIGVPLSVLMIEDFHTTCIFEAGISQPNEMQNLEEIINPDYGIFTNIGPAHSENFFNTQDKIFEKVKLFLKCKKVVACSEHSEIIDALHYNKISTFLWGYKTTDNIRIINKTIEKNSTTFTIEYSGEVLVFKIPFADSASSQNAMNCFATMVMLGYNTKKTCELMSLLSPVAMRLELRSAINSCFLINDSYNSDLHSLSIALDFLNQQKQHRETCVILSDMFQTGLNSEELYKKISIELNQRNISRLIAIGENISNQQNLYNEIPKTEFYKNTNDFLENFKNINFKDEAILIKGARKFEFEKIVRLLEQKTHNTVFEINLNSILHNLNTYKSTLKPTTKIMTMVKSFSYGCGSYEIASLLQHHHVEYLCVAYADEGVELRKNGIVIPIMVMIPEENTCETILKYNLEPEIYSFESLNWFTQYKQIKIRIHLKIDSGMNRLGFLNNDLDKLIKILKEQNNIEIASVFSHLSAADDEKSDIFTYSQIEKFKNMTEKIKSELNISPKLHILNSAGIERFPDAQFDMVRLGLGLYGVKTTENKNLNLQNVGSLKSRIIQIKNISVGERVGYGSDYIAQENLKVAIVSIGYGDGFRRILSNGKGKIRVNDYECEVIGKVCMDMTIINVSGINVNVGDEAIIFDEKYNISDFAKDMDVIPYEVLTGISQRVKRTYLYE